MHIVQCILLLSSQISMNQKPHKPHYNLKGTLLPFWEFIAFISLVGYEIFMVIVIYTKKLPQNYYCYNCFKCVCVSLSFFSLTFLS